MLRVVFFGNSEGAFSNRHFAALKEVPCKLAAVVDVPPSRRLSTNAFAPDGESFVEYAGRRGIPAFEPDQPNSPEFVAKMRDLRPDLVLAVGYLNRLREELLSAPRLLAANFHASLLPAYRGLHPVFQTLRGGERWGGLTVHFVDAGLDTGDILYQVRVRIRRNDSVGSLYDRITDRSVGLVERLITDAEANRLPRRPQPTGGESYFSTVTDEDYRLDWGRPAEELRRWICATPGRCFCDVDGQRVYFAEAELARGMSAAPGTLVRIGRTRCIVAAGGGALNVCRIRYRAQDFPAAEWCREHGLKAGEQAFPASNF
jgi:methionyl-tRNA formyltransferase